MNAERKEAIALLSHAAKPERRHLWLGFVCLIIAALLEAAGPLLGKHFIDHYLLPRTGTLPDMALLLGGILLTGLAATGLRYLQLLRLAGVAMRSVQRLREEVYGHVLALPDGVF